MSTSNSLVDTWWLSEHDGGDTARRGSLDGPGRRRCENGTRGRFDAFSSDREPSSTIAQTSVKVASDLGEYLVVVSEGRHRGSPIGRDLESGRPIASGGVKGTTPGRRTTC